MMTALRFLRTHRYTTDMQAPSGRPGAVARSVAMPLGMQAVPRSIPAFGKFFCDDFVMEIL